MGKPSKK
ncbi:efffbc40-3354-4622-ad78-6d3d904b12b6 [Thermothielavioides terrestris]|nr:efffbc40-3354-4622-ad78-6d3d904b12b6 [Thermothielavioides terrestris]